MRKRRSGERHFRSAGFRHAVTPFPALSLQVGAGRQLGDAYHEGSGVPVANREGAVGAQATWRGPPVRRAYDGTGAEAPLQTRRGGDGTPHQNQPPSPRCAAFVRLGWPLSRNWFCLFSV